MFKLCFMSGRWFAIEVATDYFTDEEEMAGVECLVSEGTPVMFCDDLEIAADTLHLDVDDIELVED